MIGKFNPLFDQVIRPIENCFRIVRMHDWTGFHRREVVEYFTRHISCNVELFGVDAYIRNPKLVAEVTGQALENKL